MPPSANRASPHGDNNAPSIFRRAIDDERDPELREAVRRHRFTSEELEDVVMPLIREDIDQETHLIVRELFSAPEPDFWKGRLALLHREMRASLASALASRLCDRYPDTLSRDEWHSVATMVITVAWLVRREMDGER